MIKEQMRLGTLPPDSEEVTASPLRPIYRGGVVFFDEKHTKCKLGPTTKMERRVSRNVHGEPCEVAMGGLFPDKNPKRTVKFVQEGRGCFGAATKLTPEGTLKGVKLPVFDYTGKEVVSMPKWEKMFEMERSAKIALGNQPTPTGKESIWKGGYEARYGERWRDVCSKAVGSSYCNVQDLITYMVRESKKLYEGTPMADTFLIYHDHLKVMREKRCIAWMKEEGYWHLFIKIHGSYNDRVHA